LGQSAPSENEKTGKTESTYTKKGFQATYTEVRPSTRDESGAGEIRSYKCVSVRSWDRISGSGGRPEEMKNSAANP